MRRSLRGVLHVRSESQTGPSVEIDRVGAQVGAGPGGLSARQGAVSNLEGGLIREEDNEADEASASSLDSDSESEAGCSD